MEIWDIITTAMSAKRSRFTEINYQSDMTHDI